MFLLAFLLLECFLIAWTYMWSVSLPLVEVEICWWVAVTDGFYELKFSTLITSTVPVQVLTV